MYRDISYLGLLGVSMRTDIRNILILGSILMIPITFFLNPYLGSHIQLAVVTFCVNYFAVLTGLYCMLLLKQKENALKL